MGRRGKPQSWVYFILAPELNRVKIGRTSGNPNRRLSDLRMMNAARLVGLAIIPGGPKREKKLHSYFARHCHHAEWFTFHENIKKYIKLHGRPWPQPEPKLGRILPGTQFGPSTREQHERLQSILG